VPRLSFIHPLDQPLGRRRLLKELRAALKNQRHKRLRIAVAWAKSGPLLRLKDDLEAWNLRGGRAELIVGIDQRGTSIEALELALKLFDKVYVTRDKRITFHPKIYLFTGPTIAMLIIGSNNLTVGGTESNFESAVVVEVDALQEKSLLADLESSLDSLLPTNCAATFPLNVTVLAELRKQGRILPEKLLSTGSAGASGAGEKPSALNILPPSPIPRSVLAEFGKNKGIGKPPKKKSPGKKPSTISTAPPAQAFAIQVKPHHNGEIFLSVTAALQVPSFFGWPFAGLSVPKKPGNPAYPQRAPDPIVDIEVIGAAGKSVLTLADYAMNTVYYASKSEIRITAMPLVSQVPPYSVMIMRLNPRPGVDYAITIHRPDSPDCAAWLAVCNQTMVRPESSTRPAGASPAAVSRPLRRVAGSGRGPRGQRTERSVESPRQAVGPGVRGAKMRAECGSVNLAAS